MSNPDDPSPRARLIAARAMAEALVKRRAGAKLERDLLSIDSMLDRARRALRVAERDLRREGVTS